VLKEARWRVTMADVDGAGIIYYASPLRWCENLFSGWLDELGHPISAMLARGEATPVVGLNVTYRSMLSLDDHCRLRLAASAVKRSSFTLCCSVWGPRTDKVAVEVLVTHAFVSYRRPPPEGLPEAVTQPLPSWLAEALSGCATTEDGGHR
jgi:YbgC/YbaW family acyl-CoA thioester hydrolase